MDKRVFNKPTHDPSKLIDFNFEIPDAAPVFEPTKEEFEDPLVYINSIRPTAERYGICKIRPPEDWQPPFAVDINKFRFTPRVQRLHELEAITRMKLNFLEQIAKFWDLQGSRLKVPVVERKILDIYTLHRLVQKEGGYAMVTRNRKWRKIAVRMGLPYNSGISSVVKSHYERILMPFDIFQATQTRERNLNSEDEGSPSGINLLTNIFGVDDGMANLSMKPKKNNLINDQPSEGDPLAKYICKTCVRGDSEESMLLCDGCDDSYHTFCLIPALTDVPKGDWRCPKCVAEEVKKPVAPFGFELAQKEYTLHQFGEMADQFKANYFNMPVHKVPLHLVEKEFWRIVSSIDENVVVEYGADLHSMDHGSGFPTKDTDNPHLLTDSQLEYYLNSPWNLNNMPVLEGSVLSHISANISGMKVPWMYVGMCFATFCWHNEDHWSYSINYLHWGEPKTWYGVPGHAANKFEETMKKVAPELFQHQPDLLHQLTTIVNPNMLMNEEVPVYRTDQEAGEFVITFPRAYHAGFNQGYNFAEAVNFAPADWLRMGRDCVAHYASLHRYCVFSHDELICKIALNASTIDPRVAAATYTDMLTMVQTERILRKKLLEWGVCDAEREAYELVPDDGRQCEFCKTTCFLSAVTCRCSSEKLVCLNHYYALCDCPAANHILRYRYTMDELPVMLQKLKIKAESFDNWMKAMKNIIEAEPPKKAADLKTLKTLLLEAKEKRFPESKMLDTLINAVHEAEKCSDIAKRLVNHKNNRNRARTRVVDETKMMTLEELALFMGKINNLLCVIDEAEVLNKWLTEAQDFKVKAASLLNSNDVTVEALTSSLEKGLSYNLAFNETEKLSKAISELKWIEQVENLLLFEVDIDGDILSSCVTEGLKLMKDTKKEDMFLDFISKLKVLLRVADMWEMEAYHLLKSKPKKGLKVFINHMVHGQLIPVKLKSYISIEDVVKNTKDWLKDFNYLVDKNTISSDRELKNLTERAKNLPVGKLVKLLNDNLSFRNKWKADVSNVFLKTKDDLIQVLCPKLNYDNKISELFNRITLCNLQWFRSFYQTSIKGELTYLKEIRNSQKMEFNRTNVSNQSINKPKHEEPKKQCFLCLAQILDVSSAKLKKEEKCKMDYFDTSRLCPGCKRSKRPPLSVINSLVANLQTAHIKFPEGEALKLLVDRIKLYKVEVENLLKATNLLGVKDLNYNKGRIEYIKKCSSEKNILKKDNIKKNEDPDNNENSTIDFSGVIQRIALLTEREIRSIKKLLLEGNAIEASIIQRSLLLRVLKIRDHVNKENRDQKKCSPSPLSSDSTVPVKNSIKSDCGASSSDTNDTSKGKSPSKLKRKRTCKQPRSEVGSDEKGTAEDEEDCAVMNCLRPVGVKVDWVQCDHCLQWYHLICIKLKKCSIKEDQEFFCKECLKHNNFPKRYRK